MAKLSLEIVTPEKTAFSGQVDKIFAETAKGIIGILPKHTSLFTLLEQGELKIVVDGNEEYYSIGGGFLEVADNKVKILVTRAVAADEIIEEQVEAARKKAEEIISSKAKGEEAVWARSTFRRSLLDLKVAQKARRKRRKMVN